MNQVLHKRCRPVSESEISESLVGLFDIESQRDHPDVGNLIIDHTCKVCGRKSPVDVNKVRRSSKAGTLTGMCRPCSVRSRNEKAERHPAWKGGRIKDVDGYMRVRRIDHPRADSRGYVLEHRLVMERMIGRHLLPGETVHHKNGNRDDNRESNLELRSGQHGPGFRYEDLSNEEVETLIDHLRSILEVRRGNTS